MNMFRKPQVPAQPDPKPLPREDDEAIRMAKRKEYASLARSSGRESNRLSTGGEARLGDYSAPAMTRGATVLGG